MRVVLITRQIGHYHDARFVAANERFGDFVVVATANEGEFGEFLARGVNHYRVERLFGNRVEYDAAILSGRLYAALVETLDRLNPDVVVVSGWASPDSLAAILWSRRHYRPVVVMSESQAFDAMRSFGREAIKSFIVRQCNSALVGADTHRDYVVRLGMRRDRVFLGYDAVDNQHFVLGSDVARVNAVVTRGYLHLPAHYILASARFIPKKNLELLIEAYCRAIRQVSAAPDLLILGDGKLRAALEQRVVSLGIAERVHMPGFRNYDELPVFYGLSEGFVHVSVIDQWGLVVNEAMASGVPIVVSRTCGVSNIVDEGAGGTVVDPTNIDDIVQALVGLFQLTTRARAAKGARNRQRIAMWGTERFGDGLKGSVECALSLPRRRGLTPWESSALFVMSHRAVALVA